MTKIIVFGRGTDGHRAEYYTLLEHEFSSLGFEVEVTHRVIHLLRARRVFFAMIDETLTEFIVCAILGMLTGRRIAGFLFRVGECFKPSLKYRIKWVLFRLLRSLPSVHILTIIPFSVEPRFAEVANDWVYDPQLWDSAVLSNVSCNLSTNLSEEIKCKANGRKILIALGAQNSGKGFDYLADLYTQCSNLQKNILVVSAGKITSASKDSANRLMVKNAFVIDRYITSDELNSLYGIADIIWAAYHPTYNQASGITGRAYQFGIPMILRKNSYISKVVSILEIPFIEINYFNILDDSKIITDKISSVCIKELPLKNIHIMKNMFDKKIMKIYK